MDQLDGDPASDGVEAGRAGFGGGRLRCRDGEGGANPLATGVDQVPGHLGEKRFVGLDDPEEFLFDPAEVVGHARKTQ